MTDQSVMHSVCVRNMRFPRMTDPSVIPPGKSHERRSQQAETRTGRRREKAHIPQ
jgi:hypothetical protein